MTPDDRDYFLRRSIEEERAAEAASSLAARWRHEELAFLYRSLSHRAQAEAVARATRTCVEEMANAGQRGGVAEPD
jgi:hypothetical protein